MEILDIVIGTDYEARPGRRVTVTDVRADLTGEGRWVRIRHASGVLERVRTAEIIRPWADVEAQGRAEAEAEVLAEELNVLLPGMRAIRQGSLVFIGCLPVDGASRLVERLRATDPLAPFVDAFQAGSPKRYSLDEGVDGWAIRDSFNGGDPVGPPFAEREEAERELDVLLAEEDATEALFEAQDRREEIA